MDLEQIHKHSIYNREELSRSKNCGCFSCRQIYPVSKITWWIDDDQTAMCPHCDTDSVIGDACGVEITRQLLDEMHKEYFEITIDEEENADDDAWHDENGDEEWDDDDYNWEKDYYNEEEELDQENEDRKEDSKEGK